MPALRGFFVNYSDLREPILTYLGFHGGMADGETEARIREILPRVEKAARFRRSEGRFTALPLFLQKEPYLSFLSGCSSVVLEAVTLGGEADLLILRLSKEDMAAGVIADACASALLEALSDEAEEVLGEGRTYRFCPGYGGSDIADVKYILDAVRADRIGICLQKSGLMLPQKSMAGFVGLGKKAQKTCAGCILQEHCTYRREGRVCYAK